jgi:hypothetical protein
MTELFDGVYINQFERCNSLVKVYTPGPIFDMTEKFQLPTHEHQVSRLGCIATQEEFPEKLSNLCLNGNKEDRRAFFKRGGQWFSNLSSSVFEN